MTIYFLSYSDHDGNSAGNAINEFFTSRGQAFKRMIELQKDEDTMNYDSPKEVESMTFNATKKKIVNLLNKFSLHD